jgi:glycosyltransferase involved in cell wall biosynthesis
MKSLNIVYIAQFAGSPKHGMQLGQYSLALEWVKMGHSVTIVSSSNAHMRFKQPVVNVQYQAENIEGIQYLWIKTPEYGSHRKIDRIKNLFLYCFHSWSRALPIKHADIVICSTPSPFSIFSSARLSRSTGATLVYEVRDLWPLTLLKLSGVSKWNPFIMLMQLAENYAYKRADYTVSVLSRAKEYMKEHGMQDDKFVCIPNGIDISTDVAQKMPESYVPQLRALQSTEKLLVGYTGKVGLSNTVHTLIDALEFCRNVHLVILGFGEQLWGLKKRVKALGLGDKVSFFDPIPKEQVIPFLSFVDIAYVGWISSPLYEYGMSSTKLNDYFLAKKPIICSSDIPDDALLSSEAGRMCAAENPKELAKAISWMQSIGNEQRTVMGEQGYRWVLEHRSYRLLANQYIDAVRNKNWS